ncbi:MAG: porin [Candidatus Latescibacterota bacterium]
MGIVRVQGCLLVTFLACVSPSAAAESDVDRLLDLLVDKGLVSREEAAGLRADLAIRSQEGKEKQKDFAISAGRPVRVSGYSQDRYQSLAEQGRIDGFDVRRARLDIRGQVGPRFEYRTQLELGGTRGPFLLDATIGYTYQPYLKVTAGQFKVPFSQENLASSPRLETINRAQVVEALVARGRDVIGNHNGRDIGVQVGGTLVATGHGYLLDYAVGVLDGAGINTADGNEDKDLVGRVVLHPRPDLDLGGSYYAGRGRRNPGPGNAASQPANLDRNRIGGEFALRHDPLTVRAEYIAGTDDATDKAGWYLQAGYFVLPRRLQGVVKVDTYDADTAADDNETTVYTGGVNVFFAPWAFLQVNGEAKRESGTEVGNDALAGQLTLQF